MSSDTRGGLGPRLGCCGPCARQPPEDIRNAAVASVAPAGPPWPKGPRVAGDRAGAAAGTCGSMSRPVRGACSGDHRDVTPGHALTARVLRVYPAPSTTPDDGVSAPTWRLASTAAPRAT